MGPSEMGLGVALKSRLEIDPGQSPFNPFNVVAEVQQAKQEREALEAILKRGSLGGSPLGASLAAVQAANHKDEIRDIARFIFRKNESKQSFSFYA